MLYLRFADWSWGGVQLIQCLPIMHEASGSIANCIDQVRRYMPITLASQGGDMRSRISRPYLATEGT